MTEKNIKLDDVNLEKHLNSKLFQKFLKKEGSKIAETALALTPPKGICSGMIKSSLEVGSILDQGKIGGRKSEIRLEGLKKNSPNSDAKDKIKGEEHGYFAEIKEESKGKQIFKMGSLRERNYEEKPLKENTFDDKRLRGSSCESKNLKRSPNIEKAIKNSDQEKNYLKKNIFYENQVKLCNFTEKNKQNLPEKNKQNLPENQQTSPNVNDKRLGKPSNPYIERVNIYNSSKFDVKVDKNTEIEDKQLQNKENPRGKFQEPEPFSICKPDNFNINTSELKGMSNYIPPGESFAYYESIAQKPKSNISSPFYPVVDPTSKINSANHYIKDLEFQVKSRDDEIGYCKKELENARQEIIGLQHKLGLIGEMERKIRNLKGERDMLERKARGLEDENIDLYKQLEKTREDAENARFKIENIERSYKKCIRDLEHELRVSKDRLDELEQDIAREKDKNYKHRVRSLSKIRDENYVDYRHEDREYDYKRKDKYDFFDDDWKGNNREYERVKNDFYDKEWNDRSKKDRYEKSYQHKKSPDRGSFEKSQDFNEKTTGKIFDQVKVRIGATNSSSISSILNWEQKPKKNDEILSIENQILQLQIEKKCFEDELAKIPEHGKKIAIIRRREEIENSISTIQSSITSLKTKSRQLQSKNL